MTLIEAIHVLIANHLHCVPQAANPLVSLLLSMVSTVSTILPYSHGTLAVDALNALFTQTAVIPQLSPDVIPAVIRLLVDRCALPAVYFETGKLSRGDFDEEFHRFRQTSQDLILAIASSPAGIAPVAEQLLGLITAGEVSYPREESIFYLFCGIVDAIEEEFLPLFGRTDSLFDETPDGKHELISETPLETPYDSFLYFVGSQLFALAVNVPLFVAGLQIFYSFDQWTFSRPDFCQKLLTAILEAFPRAPESMVSRLLMYIMRLLDAPAFHFGLDRIHQLMELFPAVLAFQNEELRGLFLRTASAAISSLPPSEALPQFTAVLNSLLAPLPALVSLLSNETPASNEHVTATFTAGIEAIRNARSVLAGCTQSEAARALADSLIPAGKTILEGMLQWEGNSNSMKNSSFIPSNSMNSSLNVPSNSINSSFHQSNSMNSLNSSSNIPSNSMNSSFIPSNSPTASQEPNLLVIRETAGLLEGIVQAAEGALGSVNTAVICELCGKLIGASVCMEEALHVVETLLSTCYDWVGANEKAQLLTAVNSLLSWTLQTHRIGQELESVKLALRIQYTLLKGEKDRIRSNSAEVLELTQLILAVSQQRINEDELIRLLLRSIFFLLQVSTFLLFENRRSPRFRRSIRRFSSTVSKWRQ